VCGGKTFTVAFSNSTQPLNLGSIIITSPPANGTATVNNLTGTITYTPAVGYLGPDTFTYEFQSTVPVFFDSEIVTVNINVVLLETYDDTITACPYNGVATYDLTTADVTTYSPVVKKYYPTLTDAQNGTNEILTPAAYVSAAGNVFVKVITPEGCVDYSKITLLFYAQPQVNDAVLESCFIVDAPATAEFDLTTANVGGGLGATKDYFPSMADAENNTNEIQNPFVYVTTSTTVYVRVYNANGCYNIAKITLTVIPPKYSTVLQDKVICIEDRTTLDAGPGFEAYEWSTGATTQTISNVGVGEYWVILTTDGCETKQTVKVNKAPEVIITNIDISNNTVTLTVTGGQIPYQYSIDGINWQDSNVFTELPRGQNTFYVKDAFDCEPISVEITVPNLINVITPNADGINDYVDYSALRYKENLTFSVYDRYGNRVHLADKNNDYKWDGRFASKKVITGTYWYHITWTEPDGTKAPVMYKGWILVKNRE
ncbi:MAG: gliding motility-associated C-terminal domain-containing protein, partial [Weeksellaceae bacterium]|nr:gliding motility-associated C-terminal domain-containing protein [Weeksellaceae bacterium]